MISQLRNILLILAAIATSPQLLASSPDSLIIKGNEAYNEGRYNESTELYLEVIDRGYESSELYYNLGNAYFKLNKMPEAILYYEKADKLDPGNEDIEFNLRLANSRIIDKIDAIPELFYTRWWKSLRNLMDADGWARSGIALFILIWILAMVFFFSRSMALRKISFWTGIIVIVMSAASFALASQSYQHLTKEKEAIIFTPTLTVKSSPNENSVDLFVIHEGTKVSITDSVEGWSEIVIANGSKGWIKKEHYRII